MRPTPHGKAVNVSVLPSLFVPEDAVFVSVACPYEMALVLKQFPRAEFMLIVRVGPTSPKELIETGIAHPSRAPCGIWKLIWFTPTKNGANPA
jgi:hypothetical protein